MHSCIQFFVNHLQLAPLHHCDSYTDPAGTVSVCAVQVHVLANCSLQTST